MNFTQIRITAETLMGKIARTGKATPADIHNLTELDTKLSDLQDADIDTEEWMNIFHLREEISGTLGSEAAGVSSFSFA